MLDAQTYDVHLFKKLDEEKASKTFSICGGTFPELFSKYLIEDAHTQNAMKLI